MRTHRLSPCIPRKKSYALKRVEGREWNELPVVG